MINVNHKSELHPGQREIWDGFILNPDIKRCVVNTGRQVGKTTLAKRAALHWAINHSGSEIGWITPEVKHFLKVLSWFKSIPQHVVSRVDSIKNVVYFVNGSIIYFYSVDNYEAIRGQTFHYRIMDEYAFGRFSQQEAISAYDPTFIAKGIKDLILSTPKGKNIHYNAFQMAQERDDEVAFSMKTEDNPMIDPDYLKSRKHDLPHSIYKQEYEGVFMESGGEVFTNLGSVCTIDRWTGQQANQRYVFGIDWGAKNDQSVLTIINKDTGDVSHIESSFSDDYTVIGKQFSNQLSNWNIESGIAELNGVGQSQFDHFKRDVPMVQGFTMTQSSKEEIVTLLRTKIQNMEVKLPTRSLCPELFNQLSDYEPRVSANGRYSYGHPKGKHDDYVDSLMFAVYSLRDNFVATSRTMKTRSYSNPFV